MGPRPTPRRRPGPAAPAALRMALRQGLVDRPNDLLVVEPLVSLHHPGLPKIADRLGNQAVGKVALRAAALKHGACPAPWQRRLPGAAARDSARRSPRSPPSACGSCRANDAPRPPVPAAG